MLNEVVQALRDYTDSMASPLYVQDGKLVQFLASTSALQYVGEDQLLRLLHSAVYLNQGKSKVGIPGKDIRRTILGNADGFFPKIVGIAHAPFYDFERNRIVATPGFDPSTGRLLLWNGLLTPLWEMPEEDATKQVLAVLDRLLSWKFNADHDCANALGLWLLAVTRPSIKGPTPLHMIYANSPNVGKSFLAECFGISFLGYRPPAYKLKVASPNEMAYQIDSYLLTRPAFMYIDNVESDAKLDSADLHVVISAYGPYVTRAVGGGAKPTFVDCVWALTGNRLELDSETGRRTQPICLAPQAGKRKYPNLDQWLQGNRDLVLSALLWMVHQWASNGSPVPERTLDTFQQWSAIIGGVIEYHDYCGMKAHWLAPTARPQPSEHRAMTVLCQRIVVEMQGTGWWKSSDVLDAHDGLELDLVPQVGNQKQRIIRMGKILSRYANGERLPSGWIVKRGQGRGGSNWQYAFEHPGYSVGRVSDNPQEEEPACD